MRKKLGEILLASGVVTEADIEGALNDQSAGEPSRLGDLLVSLGKLTPEALARALAEQYGLPFVQLSDVSPALLRELPEEFQRQHRVVPFKLVGGVLSVAVADPPNAEAFEGLHLPHGRRIATFVAAGDEIDSLHAGAGLGLALAAPPKSSPPSGAALSADDLFADLSLDTVSGIRPAPDPVASPRPTPEPESPDRSRDLTPSPFGREARSVSEATPPAAEPEAMPEGAFRPSSDSALATVSGVSFSEFPAPTSPSGIRELKMAPAGPDPVRVGGSALTLPDWLRTPASEPIAAASPGSALATTGWTGALDPVAPSKLVVALIKSLLSRGVVTEQDLLDALDRK